MHLEAYAIPQVSLGGPLESEESPTKDHLSQTVLRSFRSVDKEGAKNGPACTLSRCECPSEENQLKYPSPHL